MSNPHPNTSGLRPFNKMDPNEAKRIRRLGGLSHAKQYYLAKDTADIWHRAIKEIEKEYGSWENLEYNMIKQAMRAVHNSYTPLSQKIRLMNFINGLRKNSYKQIDKMNALLYKTGSPEFQMSDNYIDAFRFNDNNDVLFLGDDLELDEDDAGMNDICSDTCSETNDTSAVKEN